jgi:hypothetical protein
MPAAAMAVRRTPSPKNCRRMSSHLSATWSKYSRVSVIVILRTVMAALKGCVTHLGSPEGLRYGLWQP